VKQRLVNHCQCPICLSGRDHPDKELHRQINLLMSIMNARQRRWFAAIESDRLGRGGITRLWQITGLDRKTIRRGRKELANLS
jgi:hypothetical protein